MTYWNDDGTTRYWKRCDDHKVKVRKDGVQTRGCRCCGSWEGPGLVPVAEGAIIIEDGEDALERIKARLRQRVGVISDEAMNMLPWDMWRAALREDT